MVKNLAFSFKGGIHPEYNKLRTFASPVEELPAPPELVIPLSMHIGTPCESLVVAGDYVKMGQKIADSSASNAVPIHSPVSGIIKGIENRWHPFGTKMRSIVITNDDEDTIDEDLEPIEKDIEDMTTEEIIALARNSGIVGMGGAAFPMHLKLQSALSKNIDIIIINGSECEPYLTADHRGMVEYPRVISGGIKLIMQCLGMTNAIVAIEDNKPDAINTMRAATEETNIAVIEVPAKYPQGGEKQLIKAVTGREVPPGALPMDVGCVVFNVDSCASLYRAYSKGVPLIKRLVTVSGSAVVNPKNLLVRIGTPYVHLFERCGGFAEEPYKIICGGPMMGTAQHTIDVPIIKSTSALLAFSGGEESFEENPTCIRCGKCVNVCPMKLMPNYLALYASKGDFEECKKLNVMDCMECGCCSYVCPGKLYLVQSMRMSKGMLMQKK